MEEEVKIIPINPETFETQEYKTSDEELLIVSELDTIFDDTTDYIEVSVYDENQNLIYVTPEGETLSTYSVKEGDVLLDPEQDLVDLGFDIDSYFINYKFYRNRLASSSNFKYYISNISSDRTEIQITSNQVDIEDILLSTQEFIQYRNDATYFVDFYLNFGSNQVLIANNIALNGENVYIKLYEPLPANFDIKSQLWVVEEISTPQSYQVTFPFNIEIPNDFTYIKGPNFNLDIQSQKGEAGQDYSYELLTSTPLTSSYNQVQNLLNQKEININVNYEDFSEFVHFSSAKTRLENFYYKVGLIESASNQIANELGQITSGTNTTFAFSSSKASLNAEIDSIIKNFDGYERFLYFNSGSLYSYPKSNTTPPYTLYSTGSTEVLNWIGSADPDSPYYGGIALSASNYDQSNKDWLYWVIPEYLRDDPENAQYELFIDMVGQHYDNIWIYIKDITNKFNADNRLEYGISKDLVAEAIKDFGIKLYSNNFNINDLYTAFLGITPSGSLFPFPEITDSLPAINGSEYVDTKISASNNTVPLDDTNKRLYKRIYHNSPYLLKTKGTIPGLKALITSYGIPDTILRINEFGGNDKVSFTDRVLKQREFNYAFDTNGQYYFSSSFSPNLNFDNSKPDTIQFRFKAPGIPTLLSQSLWSIDSGNVSVVLEYTGSGLTSGSYSGSIADPYNTYGVLKFIPDSTSPELSASLYLPFFNGGWWSVMTTQNGTTATLQAANVINGELGFTGSDSITGYGAGNYNGGTEIQFPNSSNITYGSNTYEPFSGSLQEIRYFVPVISQSAFFDYVLNPYSDEGNTVNSTPSELMFRADLGTTLNTSSRTSIHPKVTGSLAYITSSFTSDSSFYLSNENFITNKEEIIQNPFISGIKNRTTDKIKIKSTILAENPSGSNDDIIALSPLRSLQQTSAVSESFTDNVNYLEIAFSPQDQINDDIIAQLGNFNLGDYIGDPRTFSSASLSYPDLDTLRDAYFDKYIKSYNVKDFIRLIKFFDNSLFKMIKDFVPARTSLSSGVVVKQHILERNRVRPAQLTFSNETFSGSIKPQSRNYNTGSGDVGNYEYISGSSIYRFSGGTGGSFEKYNGLNTSPSQSAFNLSNKFSLTQSYGESIQGSVNSTGSFPGFGSKTVFDQKEFYDGEFSGSHIIATTQSLNPGCAPYLKVVDTPISFRPLFFSTDNGASEGTITLDTFIQRTNSPASGDAWILYSPSGSVNQVTHIKLSAFDENGLFVRDFLNDSNIIEAYFPDISFPNNKTTTEYYIKGTTPFATNVLLTLDTTKGDINVTGSSNGGSENWSLRVDGDYTSSMSLTQSNDNLQQGTFLNPNKLTQNQVFTYWNGNLDDAQELFNTGSSGITLSDILSNENYFEYGAYNTPRTSNIPWLFTLKVNYSASNTNFTGGVTSSGTFHSASHYSGVGLTDQSFTLSSGGDESGIYVPSPLTTNLESAFFTTTYNNLIPGNSGSGEATAGHPQIINAGTASLDFYFPSLKLSGTAPSPSVQYNFTPFSGSSLNGSNSDFATGTSSDLTIGQMSSLSASLDGAFTFFTGGMENYVYGNPLQPKLVDTVTIDAVYFRVRYSFTSNASNNITASVQYNDDLSQSWTTNTLVTTTGNGSGTWSYNQTSFNLFFTSDPGDGKYYVRPVIKSPESSFTYTMTNYDIDLRFDTTTQYDSESPISETYTINSLFDSTGQNGTNNTMNPIGTAITTYSTADIQVHLKATGSDGERIITSSQVLSGEDIYAGALFEFSDSPILDIFNSNSSSADTGSTITQTGDMYFIEYSMSNFSPGTGAGFTTVDVDFLQTGDTGSKILIEQRISEVSSGYNLTGSLYVAQGNADDKTSVGSNVLTKQFIVDTATTVGSTTLTGSFEYPFDTNDAWRMGMFVNKNYGSGVTITEYSMSIFPSSSVNAPILTVPDYDNYKAPTSTAFIIPTYFGENVLPFDKALDCQPLVNNYNSQRENSYLMDVDYTNITGSLLPVNQAQILANIATKATVPDSNYTTARSINSRYKGSKSTSQQYNVWSIKDEGTYGKSPTIELRNAYFAYFSSLLDFYPLLNDTVGLNFTYLIDQQGNAIPPSLEEEIYLDTLEKTFNNNAQVSVSILTGSRNFQLLNDSFDIVKLGSIPTPIAYSQTGSQGYSDVIPLSSSRRISAYDNNDSSAFHSYSFTAEGSSSFSTNNVTSFDTTLNPSTVATKSLATASYQDSGADLGNIIFPNDPLGNGDELSQDYLVSVDTLLDTSFLRESNRVEMEIKLILEKSTDNGSTYSSIPPTLEDIELYVLDAGESKLIGSVARGNDDIIRFITGLDGRGKIYSKSSGFKKVNRKDRRVATQTPIVNSNNEIEVVIENYALDNLLKANGYDINNPTYTLQWRFKANSGDNRFEQGNYVRWRMSGFVRGGANTLFPGATPKFLPTRIKMIGSRDHLFANDNTANAPFWVFTGSAGGENSVLSTNILVMSSSNFNEAYGSDSFQGNLPYDPGASEYFPGGSEPIDTQFPSILYPLEFAIGDEIRFINNENYSYRINKITPPQENVEGDNKGRLKIELDGNVPQNIDKNFFLVRRYIPSANSMIIDSQYPYSTPPSSSTANGVIFPPFPALELEASASLIIADLNSKGIIK
jgi:hypothetical protein